MDVTRTVKVSKDSIEMDIATAETTAVRTVTKDQSIGAELIIRSVAKSTEVLAVA